MLPELSWHPNIAVHGKHVQHDVRNPDKELVVAVQQLQSLQAKRDCSKPKAATRRKCHLLPNSVVRATCDCITSVLLFLLWAYEPMGLWFDSIRSTSFDTAVIIWFCIEMLTNMFTAYQDEEGELICVQPAMLCKYCKSWFAIDLLSTIPWDRITVGAGGDDNLLRLSRLLRLTKLFKLLRVSHYAARLVKHFDAHPSAVRLSIVSMVTLFSWHSIGCVWLWLRLETENDDSILFIDATTTEMWLIGLSWALSVSAGGGPSMPSISRAEAGFAALIGVAGIFLQAIILGSVSSIVESADRSKHDRALKLASIQSYLTARSVPLWLNKRVREYCERALMAGQHDAIRMLEQLPQGMKLQLAVVLHGELISRCPLFKFMPAVMVANIISVLESQVVMPHDVVLEEGQKNDAIYFVRRGELSVYKLRTSGEREEPERRHVCELAKGDSFGEQSFVDRSLAQATVEAISASDLLFYRRAAHDMLCIRFPEITTHVDGFRKEKYDEYKEQRHRALRHRKLARKSTFRRFVQHEHVGSSSDLHA